MGCGLDMCLFEVHDVSWNVQSPLPCWTAVRACKGFKFQRTMEETSKFQMNTSLCIRAGKSDENHIHRYIQRYSTVFAWFTTRMAINSITINLYIWLAKLQKWSLKKNINIYDYNIYVYRQNTIKLLSTHGRHLFWWQTAFSSGRLRTFRSTNLLCRSPGHLVGGNNFLKFDAKWINVDHEHGYFSLWTWLNIAIWRYKHV